MGVQQIDVNQRWLKGTEAAALLGITKMCLWRWERDKKLGFPQPSRVKSRPYYDRQAIDRWMLARVGKKSKAA
jgi:predicted DNA-binding transcriptional regulator AlpA